MKKFIFNPISEFGLLLGGKNNDDDDVSDAEYIHENEEFRYEPSSRQESSDSDENTTDQETENAKEKISLSTLIKMKVELGKLYKDKLKVSRKTHILLVIFW